jgi:DNA gyrase subunit B
LSTETTTEVEYGANNIITLKDAAHIRQNPGMYVGNVGSSGLHHIVYEIVYNSVDEALAGYCKHIKVILHIDGSITVSDDGRGIPVDTKADTGRSTLEEALTIAGTSGKFDNAAYKVSAGLHGMGAKAMNALSEWCRVEVRRSGRVYKMEFERGYKTSELVDLGPAQPGQTGTLISFKPDLEIFGGITFSYETLSDRFREIAYLNKGLALSIHDEHDNRTDHFQFDGGIAEYVSYLSTGEMPVHQPIYVSKTVDGIQVEVALQYTNSENERVLCFTNNAYNPGGGTHLSGLRSGLTRAINVYGKKEGHFRENIELKGEDFREGLTAVVSLGHPDPLFESQTKIKLNNPEVDGIVASVVYEFLQEYMEKNPKESGIICKKIMLSAEARIAARKARDALKDRKNILSGGGLPGKLMDCTTRDRDKSELFLVEGNSAGGSADNGRDRFYQAVLPLRGKVLNVEKARLEKLLRNEEIASLIAATGVDIGNVEDISKLRYGKIIILTDADVDGQHIRTLLLTFFFRQMRKVIETGHLYVARPPLFKVVQRKETRFVQTREEMIRELFDRGLKEAKLLLLPVNGRSEQTLEGDRLRQMLPQLDEIESALQILERRGYSFESFLKKANEAGLLPYFHVTLGLKEFYFHTKEQVEAFRVEQSQKLGREITLADEVAGMSVKDSTDQSKTANEAEDRYRFVVDEWHEIRNLNKLIAKLNDQGFEAGDLLPLPRVAGREPLQRFEVIHGESHKALESLRTLPAEVRAIGEKGIAITRFKGLGEMDGTELSDTTLDPKNRTLQRVTLNDAFAAEKMFRTLMGDEVEDRREFILKHRANVEDIDYGA